MHRDALYVRLLESGRQRQMVAQPSWPRVQTRSLSSLRIRAATEIEIPADVVRPDPRTAGGKSLAPHFHAGTGGVRHAGAEELRDSGHAITRATAARTDVAARCRVRDRCCRSRHLKSVVAAFISRPGAVFACLMSSLARQRPAFYVGCAVWAARCCATCQWQCQSNASRNDTMRTPPPGCHVHIALCTTRITPATRARPRGVVLGRDTLGIERTPVVLLDKGGAEDDAVDDAAVTRAGPCSRARAATRRCSQALAARGLRRVVPG